MQWKFLIIYDGQANLYLFDGISMGVFVNRLMQQNDQINLTNLVAVISSPAHVRITAVRGKVFQQPADGPVFLPDSCLVPFYHVGISHILKIFLSIV